MAPTERPILFSAPMVRAILAGRKTMTRRVLKPQPEPFLTGTPPNQTPCEVSLQEVEGRPWPRIALGRVITDQEVRYRPGLNLWVRERCHAEELPNGHDGVRYAADDAFVEMDVLMPDQTPTISEKWVDLFHYRKRPSGMIGHAVPSIHMPRWASRITLRVTKGRVERLQDISEADAIAEGWPMDENDPISWFAGFWDHINGPGSWDANPWVYAVTFERI